MSDTTTQPTSTYLVVDSPHEVARWRPLVNWLLSIPHFVISEALQTLAGVAFVIYWLTFLFTGTLNPGLYGAMALNERYSARASGFLVGYSQKYPQYDFTPGAADNGAYAPVRLSLPDLPATAPSRGAALNVLKAIPVYLVMVLYFVAAAVVALIAWFAVLFTGRWPKGMRTFLVRVGNFYYRVWTYVTMVDNRYPRFALPSA